MVFNSIAADGSTANVTLTGAGFIEGNGTLYRFGAVTVPDPNPATGPDVTGTANTTVTLTVPLGPSKTVSGDVSVQTAGGVSAVITV